MSTSESTVIARREVTAVAQGGGFSGDETSWNTAQRIAKALASSALVPVAYKDHIPNCLLALEYSHRLGVSVLAVMQNLDIIHNRPSFRATFLIGCANASGRYTPLRFRWTGVRGTDSWGCFAIANDKATGEECEGPEITIQMAKDEGWYNKSGSKWKTIPQLMLMYRAGSWWSRVYAPELSLGLHTTDELEDMGNVTYERVQSSARLLDAGDDDAPAGDGVTEFDDSEEAEEARDRVHAFVTRCNPTGGGVLASRRQEIRDLAVKLFEFGDDRLEQVLDLAEHEGLSELQAAELVNTLSGWQQA
jgi:hypothetical protein